MVRILFPDHKDVSGKAEAVYKTKKEKQPNNETKKESSGSRLPMSCHWPWWGREGSCHWAWWGGKAAASHSSLELSTTCGFLPPRVSCTCHPAPPLKVQNCLINKWLSDPLILHLRAGGKEEAHSGSSPGTGSAGLGKHSPVPHPPLFKHLRPPEKITPGAAKEVSRRGAKPSVGVTSQRGPTLIPRLQSANGYVVPLPIPNIRLDKVKLGPCGFRPLWIRRGRMPGSGWEGEATGTCWELSKSGGKDLTRRQIHLVHG